MYIMVRKDGRREDLKSRDNLVRVLYTTNKKAGTRTLTYKQCGAIADKIATDKRVEFCGRLFLFE